MVGGSKLTSILFLHFYAFQNIGHVISVRSGDVKRIGNVKVDKGKSLNGHVIETHHVTDALSCIFLCVANTNCKSINYKPRRSSGKDVCELNKASRRNKSTGRIRALLYENDSSSDHYYDMDVEESRSCLDYLRNGATENGIYTITDVSGHSYPVWCDLTSESRSAWTLIMSHTFQNRYQPAFCNTPFTEDAPINQRNPNWEAFRLSRRRMQFLFSQSTHWRVTSSTNKYGVDFRDYLRVRLSAFDILNFQGRKVCKNVEYINIRGIRASSTTVAFWQYSSAFLHTDSSNAAQCCSFDASQGVIKSEKNFGNLCEDTNPAFRACESNDSTNEHWFGGYL